MSREPHRTTPEARERRARLLVAYTLAGAGLLGGGAVLVTMTTGAPGALVRDAPRPAPPATTRAASDRAR